MFYIPHFFLRKQNKKFFFSKNVCFLFKSPNILFCHYITRRKRQNLLIFTIINISTKKIYLNKRTPNLILKNLFLFLTHQIQTTNIIKKMQSKKLYYTKTQLFQKFISTPISISSSEDLHEFFSSINTFIIEINEQEKMESSTTFSKKKEHSTQMLSKESLLQFVQSNATLFMTLFESEYYNHLNMFCSENLLSLMLTEHFFTTYYFVELLEKNENDDEKFSFLCQVLLRNLETLSTIEQNSIFNRLMTLENSPEIRLSFLAQFVSKCSKFDNSFLTKGKIEEIKRYWVENAEIDSNTESWFYRKEMNKIIELESSEQKQIEVKKRIDSFCEKKCNNLESLQKQLKKVKNGISKGKNGKEIEEEMTQFIQLKEKIDTEYPIQNYWNEFIILLNYLINVINENEDNIIEFFDIQMNEKKENKIINQLQNLLNYSNEYNEIINEFDTIQKSSQNNKNTLSEQQETKRNEIFTSIYSYCEYYLIYISIISEDDNESVYTIPVLNNSNSQQLHHSMLYKSLISLFETIIQHNQLETFSEWFVKNIYFNYSARFLTEELISQMYSLIEQHIREIKTEHSYHFLLQTILHYNAFVETSIEFDERWFYIPRDLSMLYQKYVYSSLLKEEVELIEEIEIEHLVGFHLLLEIAIIHKNVFKIFDEFIVTMMGKFPMKLSDLMVSLFVDEITEENENSTKRHSKRLQSLERKSKITPQMIKDTSDTSENDSKELKKEPIENSQNEHKNEKDLSIEINQPKQAKDKQRKHHDKKERKEIVPSLSLTPSKNISNETNELKSPKSKDSKDTKISEEKESIKSARGKIENTSPKETRTPKRTKTIELKMSRGAYSSMDSLDKIEIRRDLHGEKEKKDKRTPRKYFGQKSPHLTHSATSSPVLQSPKLPHFHHPRSNSRGSPSNSFHFSKSNNEEVKGFSSKRNSRSESFDILTKQKEIKKYYTIETDEILSTLFQLIDDVKQNIAIRQKNESLNIFFEENVESKRTFEKIRFSLEYSTKSSEKFEKMENEKIMKFIEELHDQTNKKECQCKIQKKYEVLFSDENVLNNQSNETKKEKKKDTETNQTILFSHFVKYYHQHHLHDLGFVIKNKKILFMTSLRNEDLQSNTSVLNVKLFLSSQLHRFVQQHHNELIKTHQKIVNLTSREIVEYLHIVDSEGNELNDFDDISLKQIQCDDLGMIENEIEDESNQKKLKKNKKNILFLRLGEKKDLSESIEQLLKQIAKESEEKQNNSILQKTNKMLQSENKYLIYRMIDIISTFSSENQFLTELQSRFVKVNWNSGNTKGRKSFKYPLNSLDDSEIVENDASSSFSSSIKSPNTSIEIKDLKRSNSSISSPKTEAIEHLEHSKSSGNISHSSNEKDNNQKQHQDHTIVFSTWKLFEKIFDILLVNEEVFSLKRKTQNDSLESIKTVNEESSQLFSSTKNRNEEPIIDKALKEMIETFDIYQKKMNEQKIIQNSSQSSSYDSELLSPSSQSSKSSISNNSINQININKSIDNCLEKTKENGRKETPMFDVNILPILCHINQKLVEGNDMKIELTIERYFWKLFSMTCTYIKENVIRSSSLNGIIMEQLSQLIFYYLNQFDEYRWCTDMQLELNEELLNACKRQLSIFQQISKNRIVNQINQQKVKEEQNELKEENYYYTNKLLLSFLYIGFIYRNDLSFIEFYSEYCSSLSVKQIETFEILQWCMENQKHKNRFMKELCENVVFQKDKEKKTFGYYQLLNKCIELYVTFGGLKNLNEKRRCNFILFITS